MSNAFRVRLEEVRLRANIPAGLNILVVCSLTLMMRSSNEDPPPVLVKRLDYGWLLLDGRHRFVAALIAGRSDLLAEQEKDASI